MNVPKRGRKKTHTMRRLDETWKYDLEGKRPQVPRTVCGKWLTGIHQALWHTHLLPQTAYPGIALIELGWMERWVFIAAPHEDPTCEKCKGQK